MLAKVHRGFALVLPPGYFGALKFLRKNGTANAALGRVITMPSDRVSLT
jgi:hypothetical protein